MASWPTYRTVVYDGRAQGFLDQYAAPGDRFDDQWRGIEWLVCRKPEVGTPRDPDEPGKFLVLVFAENGVGTKPVWILYSFGDSQVTIHAINLAPATDADEEQPG